MTCYILVALLLSFPTRSVGQLISKAYCGKDGKAHINYKNGPSVVASPEPKQVGCDNVVVANDGRTVGWTVLMDNCCTSYPIPLSVIVMKNGKSKVFNHVQMVWKWRFVDDGKHLAVLWGPVHGWPSAATLYASRSGKQLSSWNRYSGAAPEWAKIWEQEFEPTTEKPD